MKHTTSRETNYAALTVLALIAFLCGAAVIYFAQPKTSASPTTVVKQVIIGNTTVSVPSWQLFQTGGMWQLVSKNHLIEKTYEPTLEAVIATKQDGFKISSEASKPLADLIAAAQKDGVGLMFSSAYRSATDQQVLYDEYLTSRGQKYVHDYIAMPGESEHQTGLAVDLASATAACAANTSSCSLNAAAISWLRAHAADYGFIERYPEGKQSITGIAGEHWHYRYVGVPLARALSTSDMTLDEFVQQTAPGYSKNL